jgi:AbrB family looped-hinge helix DNA binding protein
MNETSVIDSAGRVMIPKALRDELKLQPGDALTLEANGDRVTLRPVRPESRMRKEHGTWVFHSGTRIAGAEADQVLADLRQARDRSLRGSRT